MAIPKQSDLRNWDGTQFTNDDIDYNNGVIANWLSNGQADLVVNSISATNGYNAQNAKIINVAPATTGTDAVNLDQVNSLINTSNPYTPFSVESGKTDSAGYSNYLQKDSDTQLTILAGNTNPDLVVVQSDGTVETLTSNVVLTISTVTGSYNIIKEKSSTPVITSSSVTEGIVFPSSPVNGDYFLLKSIFPYVGYKYNSVGGWTEQSFVKMGLVTVAAGVATLSGIQYNSRNLMPDYLNGTSKTWGTEYRATENGYLNIYGGVGTSASILSVGKVTGALTETIFNIASNSGTIAAFHTIIPIPKGMYYQGTGSSLTIKWYPSKN